MFFRCRKLHISLVFITQSYFSVPKDFTKIYRECTEELYNFLAIDTTLPASDPLRFGKNFFDSYVFKNTSCKATYKNDSN